MLPIVVAAAAVVGVVAVVGYDDRYLVAVSIGRIPEMVFKINQVTSFWL